MPLKWEYDGKFWRFEPNPPDCESAVFEIRGKFHCVVNGWSPCMRVEEYLEPTTERPWLDDVPEGSEVFGSFPQGLEFDTLQEAQAYCERKLRESVMRSAVALGIQSSPGATGTSTIVYYCEPIVIREGDSSI